MHFSASIQMVPFRPSDQILRARTVVDRGDPKLTNDPLRAPWSLRRPTNPSNATQSSEVLTSSGLLSMVKKGSVSPMRQRAIGRASKVGMIGPCL